MYKEISRLDRTLRSYQQDAKEKIFSAWDECNNIMFQMPTGTGKTRLFTSIISDIKAWGILHSMDAKILIIAHRIELIEQISENLGKYGITHGIIAGGKERDLSLPVQVASIQTITHHTNESAARELRVNFIIIDEAHHSIANSYRKLWKMFPDAKVLGVTATPWRMNNRGFSEMYDRLILSKPIKEFIKEGWLAPYDYYSIKESSSLNNEINNIDQFDIEGDYKTAALETVVDTSRIRAQLLDSYLKYARGKKGIIYSISRKHSDHICNEFKQAGVNIVRIDSLTPRDERKLYVKRFRSGLIDIIVNVDIFSEGFDCPDIEFIQLARPTKSLVKYIQQVGRGLRPTANKSRCLILDNVGLHLAFGLPDADQDWEKYFEGEIPSPSNSGSSGGYTTQLANTPEPSFEEGNDEMCLIVSKDEVVWTEHDNELLKALYFDKHCSIPVLSAVFKLSEQQVEERIKKIEQ